MSLSFLQPRALPRPSTIRQFLRYSSTSAPKPYKVLLSPSNQLPVYQQSKRGGNKLQTKIKNITGDIQQLRSDLQILLEVADEKEVQIKAVVEGQIIVKVCRGSFYCFFFGLGRGLDEWLERIRDLLGDCGYGLSTKKEGIWNIRTAYHTP